METQTTHGQCQECGTENSLTAEVCTSCGTRLPWADSVSAGAQPEPAEDAVVPVAAPPGDAPPGDAPPGDAQTQLATGRLQGLIGSVILAAGTFAPAVSHVIDGNISYLANNIGEGVLMLILAAASLLFVLINRYRLLWFTGLAALAMIIMTIARHQLDWLQEFADFRNDATNPMRSAEIVPPSQITWGVVILLLGAVLILMAAAKGDPIRLRKQQVPTQTSSPEQEPEQETV